MHIPVRLLGFMGPGVNKGPLAALYQSRVLGGYVPRGSVFAGLQSFGATIPSVKVTLVFLLAGTGVVLFLARNLCFWCN
ncbi:hypothetical protein M405DRAFT_363712 [Rhizopogon salebrosus TDB-379]|nr:hypothetical protein M405DRAFT_363712 [Rhizopogon salebrosus TDB-379]